MGIKYPGIDKFPIAVTNEEIESMKSYKYEDEKTLTEKKKQKLEQTIYMFKTLKISWHFLVKKRLLLNLILIANYLFLCFFHF